MVITKLIANVRASPDLVGYPSYPFMGLQASAHDNVAHFVHFEGMAIGAAYIYLRYIFPNDRSGKGGRDKERERLKRQFTLIVNQPNDGGEDTQGPVWH